MFRQTSLLSFCCTLSVLACCASGASKTPETAPKPKPSAPVAANAPQPAVPAVTAVTANGLEILTAKTPAAPKAAESPFAVRALHLEIPANLQNLDALRTLIDQAGFRGYNAVILMLGTEHKAMLEVSAPGKFRFRGMTPDKLKVLIAHAREVCG